MASLADEQIARARQLYSDGATLGEIAAQLHCSVYDLSPWLYMEHMRELVADAERRFEASEQAEREDEGQLT